MSDKPKPSIPDDSLAAEASTKMTDVSLDTFGDALPKEASEADVTNSSLPDQIPEQKKPANRQSLPTSKRAKQPPPTSLNNRSSHAPGLTSNAFFRPMSSQRLQAQRSGTSASRPQSQTNRPQSPPTFFKDVVDDAATDFGGSVIQPNPTQAPPQAPPQHDAPEETNVRSLPSRGTEWTEPETYDRRTANTSPTGQYGSTSESVHPLHERTVGPNGMSIRVDRAAFKELTGPIKSPRSFRNSFLMPGRKSEQDSARERSIEGAEKLSSGPSSPQSHQPRPRTTTVTRLPKEDGKVYEYFEGNTIFFFGGRWQNMKGRPINVATGLLIVIPCALFFAFEAPWLWHNISPAVPIVFAYIAFISLSSYIHASVADPGILPRYLHRFPPWDENDDPLRVGPPTNDWTMVKSMEKSTAAMEVPVKHCRTCNIWRPPRAHHCRLCDNCIEGHDHHCVWLNNCIGKRNYRFFFAFLAFTSLIGVYLIGSGIAMLVVYSDRENVSFGKAMNHFRVPFALVIYGFFGMGYPISLMGYHIFLMARGETTREYMNSHKFDKKERYRPFSQGNAIKNIITVLCRPRPPTYYQFKTKHQAGDQRLGVHNSQRQRATSQGLEMLDVNTMTGFQGGAALRGQQGQQ